MCESELCRVACIRHSKESDDDLRLDCFVRRTCAVGQRRCESDLHYDRRGCPVQANRVEAVQISDIRPASSAEANLPVEEKIDQECPNQSGPVDKHRLPCSWDVIFVVKGCSSEDELGTAKIDRCGDSVSSVGVRFGKVIYLQPVPYSP